jgi:hypothetical protein
MSLASPLFLWLPLIAVAAHLIEEFVWPGGFADWYRAYRPDRAASVTVRFLVVINAVLVLMALIPPMLGGSPRAMAMWLVIAAIGAANTMFHGWATLRTRVYSPGVVTGAIGYLPLAALGWNILVRTGVASIGTTIQAVVVGIGFHLWSAWNHRRRAAARVS